MQLSTQLLQVSWFTARRSGASHRDHACRRRSLCPYDMLRDTLHSRETAFSPELRLPFHDTELQSRVLVNQPRWPLVAVSPSDNHFARIPVANVIAVSDVAQPCADCRKIQASEA
jgi:hypothetical protein